VRRAAGDGATAFAAGVLVLLALTPVLPSEPTYVIPTEVSVPKRISERWRWVQQHCQPDATAPQCATLPPPAGR